MGIAVGLAEGRIRFSPETIYRNDSKASRVVQSPLAKNISLNPLGKSALPARSVLARQEWRSANVTSAGEEAVDAAASARKVIAGRIVDL